MAELSCLHGQHVRHRPPFQERAWVLDEVQRGERIGTELDCPLCDRAELPAGLQPSRTAGPFDAASLPAGLRRTHRIAAATWGVLRVVRGSAHLDIEVDPPLHRRLEAGDSQPIPPEAPHLVALDDAGVIEIDFLVGQPLVVDDA